MLALRKFIDQVSPTEATVLLTGESGTGKEVVALRIHAGSKRRQKQFVALNCSAIPEQLMESELFGYEKGAFSGAFAPKPGLFEAAHRGTLFLDEIGDMPMSLQAKLLRALQDGEIMRLGSTRSQKVDVRIISATHCDLRKGIKNGSFREDLLFRLDVVGIEVPPLRDRRSDIPELADHFLKLAVKRDGKSMPGFSRKVMDCFMSYAWPGNVRELSNVIERGVIFEKEQSEMSVAVLPDHMVCKELADRTLSLEMNFPGSSISVPVGASLREVEEILIQKTLEATHGDKNMTAKLLGINSRTIYRRLRRSE